MSEGMQLPPVTFTEITTPGRFTGRTVIVTGAGSGIGRATALRIAREGGRVIASDISSERLESLVAEHSDLSIVPVAGDVSSDAGVAAIIDAAGPAIYGLVNNAGIMDSFQPIGEVDDATWERVFAVNVTGMVKLTRAALPAMLEAGAGSVVNLASEAGFRGSCAGVAYTASKHAVVGITRNSAVMYQGTGVRFNAVAPGAVATNIVANFASVRAGEVLGPIMGTNVKKVAYPDELAASITYLLSPDAPNVNGVILPVDGGWSAI